MSFVYLGLGTNLGDKERNLNEAVSMLSFEVGCVFGVSSFYSSKPAGFKSENEFLNAAVWLETFLSPFDLLFKIQEIERHMGRAVNITKQYVDRIIDIDILLYDNLIINQLTLKIPHPLLAERDFVLIPLSEIAPNLVHPVLKKKIKDLIQL